MPIAGFLAPMYHPTSGMMTKLVCKLMKNNIITLILLLAPALTLQGDALNPERVFVHTDRNIYVAGEDMLYSFFLYGNPDSDAISTAGYLELININNAAVAQSRLILDDGFGHGVLSIPDSLTTGLYMLSGYTRFMRNYGEETFFSQAIVIYNPFKENLKTAKQDTVPYTLAEKEYTAKSVNIENTGLTENKFGTRKKVSMRLKLDSATFSRPELCNLSISVAVSSSIIPEKKISTFTQALKNGYPPDSTDGNNLLFGETTGPYLEGSLISRETLEPVKNRRLYLSIPGKSNYLSYYDSDDKGNFRFLVPSFRGNREFIIQVADFRDDIIIKTGNPFAGRHEWFTDGNIHFTEKLLDYASRLGVNYQVNKIYETGQPEADNTDRTDTGFFRFYGEPDIEVFLDDYIDLPTMEEVFHELVPGVALRRRGDGAGFVFVSEPGDPPLPGPDAVFLDGVILDDPSFIAGLDPELIERIDVIKGKYQIGNLILNGIVSIVSLEGGMCDIDYPNTGLRTSLTILEEESRYKNMDYSVNQCYDPIMPDFRNTLYWNPTLKPDDEGMIEFTFHTSDFVSDYLITLQGITDRDEAIYYSKKIIVTR